MVFFLALFIVACDDEDKPTPKPLPATYTVAFDTDSGTPTLDAQTVKSGEQVAKPTPDPTKPDSVFTNWINTADNQVYDFSAPVTEDLNLKAAYAKAYKVTFDTDGGMPKVETQTIKSGEQVAKPTPDPTKPDSVFTNWINTADNQVYDFSTPVTEGLNLKATYAKAYKVTFDTDGGMPKVETQTIKSGAQAQQPTTKPAKSGFVFKKWINKADSVEYNFFQPVTEDLNLKAAYASIRKVTFHTDGGSAIDAVEVADGEMVGAPVQPVKTDRFFAGWYKDDKLTVPYNFFDPVTADIDLYVKWSGENIPDENFRAYLKQQIPDAFNGDQLDPNHENVKEVKNIDVASKGIFSLEGIQYFTALTELQCSLNQLSALDVSENTALKKLSCLDNRLNVLDVSGAAALTELDCSENQLTSLEVSTNTALTGLYCYDNRLTELDVANNTALRELYCNSNELSVLDVSNARGLTALYCDDNELSALNVSFNTALRELDCSYNTLTSLDISKNADLLELDCSYNQLASLDVSDAKALKELYCFDNLLTSLDLRSNKKLTSLSIYYVDSRNRDFPNDKLAEIFVHQDILCIGRGPRTSGVKGIFEANKETLDMRIISYDDNGSPVQDYDEAAYEAACP